MFGNTRLYGATVETFEDQSTSTRVVQTGAAQIQSMCFLSDTKLLIDGRMPGKNDYELWVATWQEKSWSTKAIKSPELYYASSLLRDGNVLAVSWLDDSYALVEVKIDESAGIATVAKVLEKSKYIGEVMLDVNKQTYAIHTVNGDSQDVKLVDLQSGKVLQRITGDAIVAALE